MGRLDVAGYPRRAVHVGVALAVTAASLTTASLTTASLTAASFTVPASAGAAGRTSAVPRDPYFPGQANTGYDVGHYDLRLDYRAAGRQLAGRAVVHARADRRLARFTLDLRRPMHVRAVTIDGAAARWQRRPGSTQKLVITPATPVRAGTRFVAGISYSGQPHAIRDPDGALDGWIRTDDGAFVADEPQGAPTWFPVNDTPDDKATYAVTITVPRRLAAISNGRLVSHRTTSGRTTWRWRLDVPVSSYLVTATIGRFRVTRGTTPAGLPYVIAVDPREAAASAPVLRQLPAMIAFFSRRFGAYPFADTGAVVDDAPNVDYDLEVASRPLFSVAPTTADLSHELAHQWFGDDVSPKRWRDIWLNEGFAEFAQWLWQAHTGGESTAAHLRTVLATPRFWNPPPGNPGSASAIFADSVYQRGAATLEALREKIGSSRLFAILRAWIRAYMHGNATVGQFIDVASRTSGTNLTAFLDRWLYRPGKP